MIGIIAYGSGNVAAIGNIYKRLKIPFAIVSEPHELARFEKYILPGVGAFDATMRHLTDSGLLDGLNEQVLGRGKHVLGVCVGMQIIGESSEEGVCSGLGWIPGRVRKIDVGKLGAKPGLPHMGWNSISCKGDSPLLRRIDVERGFYFLHSYYFDAADPGDVIAEVYYGASMPCAVAHGNVFGVQFHPEKSHGNGVEIFRNFAAL